MKNDEQQFQINKSSYFYFLRSNILHNHFITKNLFTEFIWGQLQCHRN